MISMRVEVEGAEDILKKLLAMPAKADRAVEVALSETAKAVVGRFQRMILNNEVRPPKKRGRGPTLYDEGRYVQSFRAFRTGKGLLKFRFVGMNRHMGNAALADLLEYGTKKVPARPHLRKLRDWFSTRGVALIKRRIAYELGRS